VARCIDHSGIPTIVISVDTIISEKTRAPRTAYYEGDFGSVAGSPNWREHQLRVLDETLRWMESFDQPGIRKLGVEIETLVEAARGERWTLRAVLPGSLRICRMEQPRDPNK